MTVHIDFRWVALFFVLVLLASYSYERIAGRRDDGRSSPPGRLVSVGTHRLHLFWQGSHGPTVVIEQGAGSPSRLWWPIQQKIAAFASVCTYDRAGYSWSECARGSRSISERAEELHTLLTNASVPGPYILVAHSYGGLIVRHFAQKYRALTAGLVLVDTPDECAMCDAQVQKFYARMRLFMKVLEASARFGFLRALRHIPALREGLWFSGAHEYAAAADDLASLKHLDCDAARPGMLGDLPIVVVTHGQPFPGPFAVLETGWLQSQQRLTALSSSAELITAQNSNHMIHIDAPEIVVNAIQQIYQRIANGAVA